MNREERRRAARKSDVKSTNVKVAGIITIKFCGRVRFNEELWTYVFGGSFIFASKDLVEPVGARSAGKRQHEQTVDYLTRPQTDPAPIPVGVLRYMDETLIKEEIRTGHSESSFRVGDVEFPWRWIRVMLGVFDFNQENSVEAQVGMIGDGVLRIETEAMKLVVMRWSPPEGVAGVQLLDAEGVKMLESMGDGNPAGEA